MYASILPLAASFYFLFNPMVTSDFGLFVWLVVFSNATRTAMSLYHVPHIALGAEMSEDFDERSKLVGYRMFFANVGVLFTFAVGFLYFFTPTAEFANGQLNAGAYPNFALLLAVLMGATIFWSGWGTRRVIPHLPVAPATPRLGLGKVLWRVIQDIVAAMRSRSFRWLFLGVLIVFVMVGSERRVGFVRVHVFLGTRPPGDSRRDLRLPGRRSGGGRSSAPPSLADSARKRA